MASRQTSSPADGAYKYPTYVPGLTRQIIYALYSRSYPASLTTLSSMGSHVRYHWGEADVSHCLLKPKHCPDLSSLDDIFYGYQMWL
jgi:hypothetical protein